MPKSEGQIQKLARKVKLLILDVDGVLTDNGLYLDDRGVESKRFNVVDGVGIRLAQRAGIEVALISGRPSKATKIRATQLKIEHVSLGQTDKIKAYKKLKRSLRVKDDQIAYMGDDLLDVPLLRQVGLPICVRNARPGVKRFARMVTKTKGGDGAVREVVDMILRAKGQNPLELAL